MDPSVPLAELKHRVAEALLGKVEGVSGVGLPARGITVYLEHDSAAIREAVLRAVEPLDLPVRLHWQVTGTYHRY